MENKQTVKNVSQAQRIEANIRGRKAGEMMASWLQEEAIRSTSTPSSQEAFWNAILDAIPPNIIPRERDQPMTEQEAVRFEQTRIPFGKHEGQRIADIPLDYLDWLCSNEDFRRMVERYLRSNRVERER